MEVLVKRSHAKTSNAFLPLWLELGVAVQSCGEGVGLLSGLFSVQGLLNHWDKINDTFESVIADNHGMRDLATKLVLRPIDHLPYGRVSYNQLPQIDFFKKSQPIEVDTIGRRFVPAIFTDKKSGLLLPSWPKLCMPDQVKSLIDVQMNAGSRASQKHILVQEQETGTWFDLVMRSNYLSVMEVTDNHPGIKFQHFFMHANMLQTSKGRVLALSLVCKRPIFDGKILRSRFLSGREFFKMSLAYFRAMGSRIDAIQTVWEVPSEQVLSDNFVEYCRLRSRSDSLSREDAAKRTWTGRQAAKYGFTDVEIIQEDAENGVGCLFKRDT